MEIKLEISNRKTTGKSPTTWKLNNTLANNPWVKEKNHTQKNVDLNQNKNTPKYVKYS